MPRHSFSILPYLEQTGLYDRINTTKAALDPVNMPPTNAAYSIAIATFLCPSAPGQPTVDYSAELSNSFNNFGINVSLAPADFRANRLRPGRRHGCGLAGHQH